MEVRLTRPQVSVFRFRERLIFLWESLLFSPATCTTSVPAPNVWIFEERSPLGRFRGLISWRKNERGNSSWLTTLTVDPLGRYRYH